MVAVMGAVFRPRLASHSPRPTQLLTASDFPTSLHKADASPRGGPLPPGQRPRPWEQSATRAGSVPRTEAPRSGSAFPAELQAAPPSRARAPRSTPQTRESSSQRQGCRRAGVGEPLVPSRAPSRSGGARGRARSAVTCREAGRLPWGAVRERFGSGSAGGGSEIPTGCCLQEEHTGLGKGVRRGAPRTLTTSDHPSSASPSPPWPPQGCGS